MYRFSAGSADRWPDGSQNSCCAKFEFSGQKIGNQRVGEGLEASCTDFRPDRLIGGRMAARIPVAPNLNFPAKKFATKAWGRPGGVMYRFSAGSACLGLNSAYSNVLFTFQLFVYILFISNFQPNIIQNSQNWNFENPSIFGLSRASLVLSTNQKAGF